MGQKNHYPALLVDWLTPIYDFFARFLIGELHLADFGSPHTWWGRLVAPLVRRFEPIPGNLDGLLPVLFQDAGFVNLAETRRYVTLFGSISILSGLKP